MMKHGIGCRYYNTGCEGDCDCAEGRSMEQAEIKINLLTTRERQATEACTALTMENQRLREQLALTKYIDDEIDEVLEQSEEDCVTAVQLENQVHSLTARLATAERERDEARHALALQEGNTANAEHRVAHEWSAHKQTIAERDALRGECERLKAAGAWKPEEVWRGEVADEIAEQIADFVGDFMDTEPVGDWRLLPRQIRNGAWRKESK